MQNNTVSGKVRLLNFLRQAFKIPFLERALARRTQGKPPDSFICKFVPNPYQYAPNSFRVVNRNGLSLRVDISDYIGHYLFFGFLDPGIERVFSLCVPSSNVIDVGANIGWTVLNFARRSGAGKVIGFEPDPHNHSVCESNLALNKLSNIKVLQLGLGEVPGVVEMEIRTPGNLGGNRVAISPGQGRTRIQIKKLDEVEEISQLPVINLIKLDVEGFELKVLRGAVNILRRDKPVLFVEVDDDNLKDQGDSARSLVEFLKSFDYKLTHAVTEQAMEANIDFTGCHFDMIAK